ncbi:hypothetical protein ACJIZ3_020300 [Penstemon smallii]|uniref:TF-B3 domain-containing protein n=1 Tax=Penstemon smallii TaxID=265156 RepID=A0ABD3SI77_9LAMI
MPRRGKGNNEMASRSKDLKACDECSAVCLTIHQKRNPSAIVTRFFKFIYGKEYSKVLYLPPKFARTVRDLAGKMTRIEDSAGKKCDVKFSCVNGSLAFQEGWPNFFQDHRLEYGDVLIFNYIKGSHFIVHVYDTTACEIVDFENRKPRQNKRIKKNIETVSQDKPFQKNDVNLMDNPISTTPVASGSDFAKVQSIPTPMDIEYLSCVLDRDDGYYQEEERNFLFDLSSFEMKRKTSNTEIALNRDITPALGLIEEQAERGDDTQMAVTHTNQTDYHSGGIFTDKFQEKPSDKSNSSKDIANEVSKVQNGERRDTISVGKPVLPSNTESRSNINRTAEVDNAATPSSKQAAAIKKELVILGQDASGFPQVSRGNPALLSNNETHSINNLTVEEENVEMPKFCDSSASVPGSMLKDTFGKQSAIIKKELAGFVQEANGFPQVSRGNPVMPSVTGSHSIIKQTVVMPKFRDSSVSSSMLKDPFGKQATAIKKEQVELGEEANGYFSQVSCGAGKGKAPTLEMKFGNMSAPVVKIEPGFSNDNFRSPPPFDAEVKNLSYLELPVQIPSIPGRRDRGQGKVVLIRDPNGRLWPLFYPHKFFFKAFTGTNWTRFCQANSIVPGDVCKFHVENYNLCTYRVDVIRKKDPHK